MTNDNSATLVATENLTDEQKLVNFKYLIYGGYIHKDIMQKVNIKIRKYLRKVVNVCTNAELRDELRILIKSLIKSDDMLEHIDKLRIAKLSFSQYAPFTLLDYAELVETISGTLSDFMNDQRVVDAIQNKLIVE